MSTALFINGIYDTVMTEILVAQVAQGGGESESFLQPYKGAIIRMLKKNLPSRSSPVRLYVSTTENLAKICYTAEIVKWEDKREMSESRRQEVLSHLERFQLKECDLFRGTELGVGKAVNLITIRNLQPLGSFHQTNVLRKISNESPLKPRSRAGGWSEVYDSDIFAIPSCETEESNSRQLAESVARSKNLDAEALAERLRTAPRVPERVQLISIGFRRNADVIVAVLNRANGICEHCRKNAPFMRRSDGTPFLEVHHQIPLAEDGEDTVENALALCPNCHRKFHHG